MRNPIQPSAERPIPLPDSILNDGWWVSACKHSAGPVPAQPDSERAVQRGILAGLAQIGDEATIERHHGDRSQGPAHP